MEEIVGTAIMEYRTVWNNQKGPSDTSAVPDTTMFETIEFKVEPTEDNTGPDVFPEPQIDTVGEGSVDQDDPLSLKKEKGLAPEDNDFNGSEMCVRDDKEVSTTAYIPGSKRRKTPHRYGCADREVVEILTKSDSECEFSDGSSGDSSMESRSASPQPSDATAHQFDDSTRGAVGSYTDSEESETLDEAPRKRSRLNDTFEWKQTNFQPIKHTFDNSASGHKCQLVKDSSILSFFMVFLSEELLQFIADETNRFYVYTKANTPESLHCRLSKWRDTGVEELYCFVAICLLMAQVKKLKISEYWSKDLLLNTPVFSEIMPRDRFILLLRMLHFSDNSVSTAGDKLFKIRNIVNKVRATFRNAFSPHQSLCIDESLFLFKDQLFCKQFIPSRKGRFGIKTYVLCDCQTGYILDFIVYTGAGKEIWLHNLGKSGNVVATLMRPYLEKGHTLYVSGLYSSPDLFLWLHNHRTNACGVVSKNTPNIPKLQRKLKKGEIEFKASGKMLVIKWCDNREVWMLTTCSTPRLVETEKTDRNTGKKIKKPQCIVEYNSTMAAIDRCDMLLSSVGSAHKAVKWYKQYFFHILDLCILNAHALHKSVTGQRITLAEFHLSLVREIVEKYATERGKGGRGRHSSEENPLRLTGRHFPDFIVSEHSRKRRPMRRCVVCAKQKVRRETRYQCKTCSIPLCVVPCFEIYHTVKYY